MKKVRQLTIVNGRNYLSTEEVAKRFGLNQITVRMYLSNGKLTTYKFKTLTLIKVDEVERWRSRQKKK